MSIGYACISIGVANTGLTRCVLKNATEEKLRIITGSNLSALEAMVEYNIKNQIRLFRISSDLIPFGSHPVNQLIWWKEYEEQFKRIGEKIKQSGMRVTMHPGQYTVLNSPDERVVQKATEELIYHTRILEALGTDEKSKLVLHIGGIYGDKENATRSFIANFGRLPQTVRDRLILENDDKNYSIDDVLKISQVIGVPVVYDNLHHSLNPSMEELTEVEWIKECQKTWGLKDGRQKIHYSRQKPNGPAGSHSDTIILQEFMEFYHKLPDSNIDLMLEVKDKNLSAVKCILGAMDVPAKKLEQEWARYKYLVLSKSEAHYRQIRELLKDKEAKIVLEFYKILEEAQQLPEDRGAQVNAAQHVWGYIKQDCTASEKKRFEKLLDSYMGGSGGIAPVKSHLLKCARLRQLEYLENSLYFYL